MIKFIILDILLVAYIVQAQPITKDYSPTKTELRIAEQVVSIFENDTPYILYNYVEKLDDWKVRGITFGRSGFTTCQDGSAVFDHLRKISPMHPLAQFYLIEQSGLKCIQSTRQLMSQKFIPLFKKYGNDESVIAAQENVYQSRYLFPSIDLMKKLNLHQFLSFVVVLDSYIQHGEGGDNGNGDVGIDYLIAQVPLRKPTNAKEEYVWIQKFLDARIVALKNGGSEWVKSIPRGYMLKKLIQENDSDFVQKYNQGFTIESLNFNADDCDMGAKDCDRYILPVK